MSRDRRKAYCGMPEYGRKSDDNRNSKLNVAIAYHPPEGWSMSSKGLGFVSVTHEFEAPVPMKKGYLPIRAVTTCEWQSTIRDLVHVLIFQCV